MYIVYIYSILCHLYVYCVYTSNICVYWMSNVKYEYSKLKIKTKLDLVFSSNFLYQCRILLHYFYVPEIQANSRYPNSPVFRHSDHVAKRHP